MKKALSIVMVAAILLAFISFFGPDSVFVKKAYADTISNYSDNDLIEFGSYPQSEVTNPAILSALNSLQLNWISYGYYSGTGNSLDGQMKPDDYMKYADVTYNGEKYRAVTFTKYRPSATGGSFPTGDTYQNSHGYYTDTVYWFKYEPISWRVINAEQGIVLCESIIDCQPFTNTAYYNESPSGDPDYSVFNSTSCTNYANHYETSSVRAWLNDNFYNLAFTAEEKEKISVSALDNSYLDSTSVFDSPTTYDKIFLLSVEEAGEFSVKHSLSGISTAYAKCQGIYSHQGYSYWWLRTPSFDSSTSCIVTSDYIHYDMGMVYCKDGIRPALKFIPNAEIVGPSTNPDTAKELIKEPSITTIKYGDSIILNVDQTKIPQNCTAEWYASNSNFSWSEDGLKCTITPDKTGDTTFWVTVFDASGKAIATDEQTMTSKAGFFDKIIAFFKKLFGLTKTIPQLYKGTF